MKFSLRFHALGWALVAAIDFTLNRAANPGDELGWSIYSAASLAGIGWLVSTLLLLIYRKRAPAAGSALTTFIALGIVVASLAWYSISIALDTALSFPYAVTFVEGLFGKGTLCLFISVAWHGAWLAARSSVRAANAERLAQEAQLQALRYQLNPHFLFNALNSAIALIDESPERAQHMLTLLSRLLRDTLAIDARTDSTVASELDLVTRYLDIERVRFEDDLEVEIEVSPSAEQCSVPPLLIHTLVENAIKHGWKTSTSKPLRISINVSYDNNALRVEVKNSGEVRNQTESTARAASDGAGVGLANALARLEAAYPGTHSFQLTGGDGEVAATVEISSPRRAA